MKQKSVLIITLYPYHGGVLTMTQQIVDYLKEQGYQVALAYYTAYRLAPQLSVPLWRLLDKTPKNRQTWYNDIPAHEVGVYLPELEWARYSPSQRWTEIIAQYDYHIVVSGNILPTLPIIAQNKPCLAWIATPYLADKQDRVSRYPWYRKLLDYLLDTPICLRMERKGLRHSHVLALSRYTAQTFQQNGATQVTYMPMPIDTQLFYPSNSYHSLTGNIGFAGRFDDPRKNVKLLIDALRLARRQRGLELTLYLVGAKIDTQHEIAQYVRAMGVEQHVVFLGNQQRHLLIRFYQSLDVFIIPSFQEGLGIVGLEAMACGCPVISTRCGGPAEFIESGDNGFLVDFSAEQIVDTITQITSNPLTYQDMRKAALQTVTTRYSDTVVKAIFWQAFNQTFGLTG